MEDFDLRAYTQKLFYALISIVAMLMVAVTFSSCKTRQVVVTNNVHDTVYQSKVRVDSFLQKDSVYVKEWQKGDTAYSVMNCWHTQYRDRLRVDTLWQTKTEEKVREVEKELSWWQNWLLWLGGIFLMLLVFQIIMIIYKIYRR